MCFFFFQAEDGIRDLTVTGVQTCALPISLARFAGRFQDELLRRLDAEWAGEPLATLMQDLRALADDLVAVVVPPPRLPPHRRTRAPPTRARTRRAPAAPRRGR